MLLGWVLSRVQLARPVGDRDWEKNVGSRRLVRRQLREFILEREVLRRSKVEEMGKSYHSFSTCFPVLEKTRTYQ